jgi:REP element-mobilizing transposase RayT
MVFLLTFSTYGTHLPGGARGSFDHVRGGQRRFLDPNIAFERWNRLHSRQAAFSLVTPASRHAVRDAIVEVCTVRSWPLLALHVRPTHLHGIVSTDSAPSAVLRDWKAYATRRLRSLGLAANDQLIWTHSGNAVPLKSSEAVQGSRWRVLRPKPRR